MKQIEWMMAVVLIGAGLSCLSMATVVSGSSMNEFIHSLITVCLWTAVPMVILGVFYLIYIKRKNK